MNNTPPPPGLASLRTSVSDDSHLILRYCREHFQRRLSEIVKLAGLVSSAAVEAFATEIGDAHDELAASTRSDGAFRQTAGLTASRISLVHNEQLELDIRIGEIANHLKTNEHIDHWRVQLRYMTLLQKPKMTAQDNPLGFEPIRRGLWKLCQANLKDSQQTLDLLDRIEDALQIRLPELYVELNGLLEHHRVEPATVQLMRRAGGQAEADTSAARPPAPNALFALQQALRNQFNASADSAPPVSAAESTSENSIVTASSAVVDAATMVMLKHLTERLDAIEQQQAAAAPLQALRAKDLDLPLGKPAAIALDTLSFIFEAIFATPDLPDAVKAAISRLQIPLLKVAILDPSFFADHQHPARRLINRMARAAIGLPGDAGRGHPTCVSLASVADGVRATFESDNGDLSPLLGQLDALISERDRLVDVGAQPYVELVIEHEAEASARLSAREWLLKMLAKTSEPAFVQFLSEYWSRVMHAACLDGGIAGFRWKESELVVNELLWTIHPKDSAEQRKRCATLIPGLIKRINAGLDLLEVPMDKRVPFFNACFALQTAALRPGAGAPAVPSGPPPSFKGFAAQDAAVDVELLEREGKLVQYLGQPTSPSSWRTHAAGRTIGDWVSFHLPDGERLCGRLCWQGAAHGTLLLFNRSWGYAVALDPARLERQLKNGQALVVSEISLFDEAAKTALGQMNPA